MSLCNVAFHLLTSEYLQLASGFMQLTAARRIGAAKYIFTAFYPKTKSEGYSFGVVRVSVHSVRPSGTISQYLLVRFDSFLVQMISTMNSRYPISLVEIDPLTLELLPLF